MGGFLVFGVQSKILRQDDEEVPLEQKNPADIIERRSGPKTEQINFDVDGINLMRGRSDSRYKPGIQHFVSYPLASKTTPSKSGGRNWYQNQNRMAEHATAKLPGSKTIPEGDPNCFQGITVVITGQLDSLDRDAAKNLIERYGGRVTTAVSSKTTYLLAGDDPGAGKMSGAEKHKTTIINEDDLLKIIEHSKKKKPPATQPSDKTSTNKGNAHQLHMSPAKTNAGALAKRRNAIESDDDDDIAAVQVVRKPAGFTGSPAKSTSVVTRGAPPAKRAAVVNLESDEDDLPVMLASSTQLKSANGRPAPTPTMNNSRKPHSSAGRRLSHDVEIQSTLWVDKYAPREVKQIIGMGSDASAAGKLKNWITNWQKNLRMGIKPNPMFSREGAGFRAVLISGPPGIGKTTTAVLVCKELDLNYVHMNASDSRSKKLLEQQLAGALANLTILDYWSGNKARQAQQQRSKAAPDSHAVMIFDEVDGVAGNEDRGGIAELIQLIKHTKFPIICICNDRSHLKVRSLANYCFDLRVNRPRMDQILPQMQKIRDTEGIADLPDDVLRQIIIASHHDIRQCINTLTLMGAADEPDAGLSSMERKKTKADDVGVLKDSIKKSPFESVREVFQALPAKYPGYAIQQKNDLFFQDYNFMPLFVQENYLRTSGRGKDPIQRIAAAADAISYGDVISSVVRGSQQAWSLLPLLSAYSCVIPGEILNTGLAAQVMFPIWLGRNSTTNKNKRSLQELLWHMKLHVRCSTPGLVCEYVPLLSRKLMLPLQAGSEGVTEVIDTLHEYDLIREDMQNLIELSTFDDPTSASELVGGGANKKTAFDLLEPKVKAALTRAFNKEGKPLPYSLEGPIKKKRGGGGGGTVDEALGELLIEEDEVAAKEQEAAVEDDDEEKADEDLTKNPNIKAVIKTKAAKTSSAAATSSARGGRGARSARGSAASKSQASSQAGGARGGKRGAAASSPSKSSSRGARGASSKRGRK